MLKAMLAQLLIGGGLALVLVFALLCTLDTRSKTTKRSGPSSKYLVISACTLPWCVCMVNQYAVIQGQYRLSLIFSIFVQKELPCEDDMYARRPLLATFINAGAVGLVNVVSLLVFTEMLCRGVHFALSFIGWIVFWAWHAIVLYWVGSSYNSNTGVVVLGTYLALHLGSLVVAFIVSWMAAIGSVPASFRMYTVAHKSIMTWVKITISAIVAAGIVVGVVLLSQDKDLRVLVSIIGDLPLLSVISISYLYYNPDTKANDLRRFTHFIQLLYKSTPLFLCLFPVALIWQHTCGDAGGWGWRILTSVVVFLITAMYNLAVYLWARTYSDFDAEPQPAMYKQLRQNWSF